MFRKIIIICLVLILSVGGYAQDWKQWTAADTTWHIAQTEQSTMNRDSAEYWEIMYSSPDDTLRKVVVQHYKNGSLRGYQEVDDHETSYESGFGRTYYPGENYLDTGLIKHSYHKRNQYYDDTLKTWWPNGRLRTLEVYTNKERFYGKSFNEQGEEVDYMPFVSFPEFPGGAEKLMQFLGNNIVYPKKVRRKNISGKVVASFVVNEKGFIVDTKIIESPHPLLSEEVLRIIRAMPKWIPGSSEGKLVMVQYNLPVQFSIR